jgi:eukaryotic-like serine/threonine-protein kinase
VFDTQTRDGAGGIFLGRVGKSYTTPLFADVMLAGASRSDELAIWRNIQPLAVVDVEATLARANVGGGPRDIAEHIIAADWSPDGRELAMVRHDAGRAVLEYRGQRLYETTKWIGALRVAPDGNRVAFTEYAVSGDDRGWIMVADLDGHARRLTAEYGTVGGLAWSLDRRTIYFSATNASRAREVHALTLDGADRVVLRTPDPLDVQDVARDGRLLVRRSQFRSYVVAPAPGATGERDFSHFDWGDAGDVSPDGRTLAIESPGTEAIDEYEIYLQPIDGAPAAMVGQGRSPKFSPDGNWVVASSIADRTRITIFPVGPGVARTLPAGVLTERWLPTFVGADQVVFVGIEPGHRARLYKQLLAGGDPGPFSPEGVEMIWGSHPVSPDGRLVVARDATLHLGLYPIAGGTPRPIPGLRPDDVPCQWTADGKSLYVVARHGESMQVDLVDVGTGQRARWKELGIAGALGGPQTSYEAPLITRDGQLRAYSVTYGESALYLVTLPR